MIARLKRRSEFLRIARAKRQWVTPGLILQIRRHGTGDKIDSGEALRIGFTVSRKVGGAVQRNRAKRRLRAAVETIFPLYAAPGHDYVVIGRRGTLTRPFPALRDDLQKALKRLGVFQETAAPLHETNA